MKRKESKETKPALKNISKIEEREHGGERKGSGRNKSVLPSKKIPVSIFLHLIEGMDEAGVKNRTAYINSLIDKDLVKRKVKANLGK